MASNPVDVHLILTTESQLRAIVADEVRKALAEAQQPDTTTEAEEQYITQSEAMALLGITRPTIIRWAKRGLVNTIKIGKTVRYRRSELLRVQKSSSDK